MQDAPITPDAPVPAQEASAQQPIGDEEVRSRLAAVVNSSDDAIVTKTLDGIITTWNPSAERMFGYTSEEVVGRPVTILIPQNQLDEEPQILRRLRRGERIEHYETIRRRKDGSLLNVSLSVSPIKDGSGRIVGASKIARDITRQKQDEAALREHSQVLELLAAAGVSIASDLELASILQRVTDIGRQLTGAESGAFLHSPASGHAPLFEQTLSGGEVVRCADLTRDPRWDQDDLRCRMPDGETPMRSYLAVPVASRSGQVLGGLFFGHSRAGVFTERAERLSRGVAAQAAVAMDNARLYADAQREIASREAAENRLREADRRKDEFLATLAHELRNPLAPIRQAAALAAAAGSTEEQKRWGHEVIARQVAHMSALLDDLLDIARITRGTFNLQPVPTTLGAIIDAAVETARPAIESRSHALRVDVPQRGAKLVGDPLRLAQILSNLLTNAAKYTDPGGNITLRAMPAGGEVRFSVLDDGIGIAPELIADVFTMFAQVKSARSRSDGGLGIGLSLAKGLAELHGGTLEARSAGQGRGSEFILRIPATAPVGTAAAEPEPAAPSGGLARSVLIADDNVDAAQTLAILLEVLGHRVVVAHDGEQALAAYDKHRPEFALLDIGMPLLNGYEVARRLRERGDRPLTLIALTGWGQAADKNRALAAGFDLHFTKPVDPDQIIEILGRRHARDLAR